MNNNFKILNETIDFIIGDRFGKYAKYIIQDRALPDIRDGLKPVQRRILFAMYELGLTYEKPYKKSARTVGEVIGKYHPHGDSSIYEAMVRMSQSWKNNLPLLDMHGNNGSIDGDPAAAMRYTECKLSKVANLMLEKIKNETVDFVFNFDDSEKEPKVLPSMFPNLLINGAVGIAAGYATNTPPFNPTEIFNSIVQLIDNPNLSPKQLLKFIEGPDFPTGGIIEGNQGILDLFETGRGKFLISSRIDYNLSNQKINQLIITEIPYDTNKSQIIKEINEIIYEEKVNGILEIRDESDKNGINIVIDVKKDKDLTIIKNYLLKNTHLQINYSANFVAIVNQKPVLLNIVDALKHYIAYALLIQKKTVIYELNKAEKRYEIVNGLILATNNIDKVIELIRKSDSKESAKQNLILEFMLSDIQAEAIVNLKLYRLSKTDIVELIQEATRLRNEINDLKLLISSENMQKEKLKKIINEYKKEYGFSRKTSISLVTNKLDINELDIIEIQDVYLYVSRDGYIKLVNKKTYESNFYNDIGHIGNDFIFYSKNCKTNQLLLIISKNGKTISLPLYKLKISKWKDVGEHINKYMNLTSEDKIIFADVIDNFNDNQQIIIGSKFALFKKMQLSEVFNVKQLKQSICIKLKKDDYIISCAVINKNTNYFVSLLNSVGRVYAFSSSEIPLLQKSASGVKSMKLKNLEYLIGFICSKTLTLDATIVLSNNIKTIPMINIPISNRGAIGKNIIDLKDAEIIYWTMTNNLSFINLILNDNSFKNVNVNKFNIKDLNNQKIKDAYFSYSNSFGLFENIEKATVLPKNIVSTEEKESQLSLINDEN